MVVPSILILMVIILEFLKILEILEVSFLDLGQGGNQSTGKIFHSGNDGSGSGLDSDTLDGVQGSNYFRKDVTETASNRITFSSGSLQLSGHYFHGVYSGTTNYIHLYPYGTSSGNASVTNIRAFNGGGGADTLQITGGSATGISWRGYTVWTAENDGSGSTLDADTLDGVQGSSYLRSDAADTGTTLTLTDALRTDRFEDQGGAFFWKEGLTSGRHRHLNLADTTVDPAQVTDSSNPTGISWGQRTDNNAYYMLGLKGQYNNGYSNHSRLTLGWHTGIEIGATATYGGVRFFGDSPFVNTTEIMQVNSSGGHVKVTNNLYANNGGLVWNANNDGSGSGLDADTLDGVNSGSFVRSDASDTLSWWSLYVQFFYRSKINITRLKQSLYSTKRGYYR